MTRLARQINYTRNYSLFIWICLFRSEKSLLCQVGSFSLDHNLWPQRLLNSLLISLNDPDKVILIVFGSLEVDLKKNKKIYAFFKMSPVFCFSVKKKLIEIRNGVKKEKISSLEKKNHKGKIRNSERHLQNHQKKE